MEKDRRQLTVDGSDEPLMKNHTDTKMFFAYSIRVNN
jgi:hypothetical protein